MQQNHKQLSWIGRRLCLLLALIFALALVPIAHAETEATLTILHVNDRHGRTIADPYLAHLAASIRADGGSVLILDAGDSLHGQSVANLSKGASMVDVMNAVGYSAMAPGNHDFNYGVARLQELGDMMAFPLLAANVKTASGEALFRPYERFEMNGLTVGVFGLATPETLTKVDPRLVAGLVFESPVEVAAAMVAELQNQGCDIIIALTHLGIDEATIPANRSSALAAVEGIDVIIDGHSHTVLDNGMVVGNTLLAQTGNYGAYIGVVEIKLTAGAKQATARLLEVPGTLAADESISDIIKQSEESIAPITAELVGHTPYKLEGDRSFVRKEETNLANVITDSMRYATGADLALLNGGGITAGIEAGDITMGQVLMTLPFSNIIVTIELSGTDVLAMLENGLSHYPELAGGFCHVSGLRVTFDPDAEPGQRVVSVELEDGSPLALNKVYTLATIDFLVAGGSGYTMLANGTNLIAYGSDAEILANYLKTAPAINAEPEGRLTIAAQAAPESPENTTQPTATEAPEPSPDTGDNGAAAWWGIAILAAVMLLAIQRSKKERVTQQQ